MAQAATLALLQALFSQWFSFLVSALEALNFHDGRVCGSVLV